MSTKSIILGTAGHIDHGKSSLVRTLTGIDPDRLKEEKERGITIDLGFANLSYPDGLTVGIVDVPGHEKLIKNMLAGAGGIDIVLMVIAADEGVMPQSREHLAICELLKIKAGIIAITKADLVDEDWLALVADDVRSFVQHTFLQDAEILPVSARTGLNIDRLKEEIQKIASTVRPKLTSALFRLPIDRVFTLKGFGTVVTGTAVSGTIESESPVEILPAQIQTKVRGLQTHGKSVERAYAGQRIGINLQGVDKDALRRGDVVVTLGRFTPTTVIDVKLEMLRDAPSVKNRSRVHFYSGTSEMVARTILYDREETRAGDGCYCQFRLEDPAVLLSGDRYIIRRFSPLETIGGGEILDCRPLRRKKRGSIDDLILFDEGLLKGKIEVKVKRARFDGCSIAEIEGWIVADLSELQSSINELVNDKKVLRSHDVLFHSESLTVLREMLLVRLRSFHKENPLKPGMPKEDVKAMLRAELKSGDRVFELIPFVEGVLVEKDAFRLKDFRVSLSHIDEGLKEKIPMILNKEGFQPPLKAELAQKLSVNEKALDDLLKILVKEGVVVRINDSMHITKEQYEKMLDLLRSFVRKKQDMTVAEFRDMLGTSRKYALPLLEYLDAHKITLRVGDVRKVMVK